MSTASARVSRSNQPRNNGSGGIWVHENSGSVGSSIRRRNRNCGCGEPPVLRTITDMTNPHYGQKFWGCRNWKNRIDNGCNLFRLLDDDVVDERDLKIGRQKKKIVKLKDEVFVLKEDLSNSRKWCKIAFVFGVVCFGFNIVLMSVMLSFGKFSM